MNDKKRENVFHNGFSRIHYSRYQATLMLTAQNPFKPEEVVAYRKRHPI